ncbi:uncharacterized protein [Nothobranchius furzeri]|uniref:uncharacterized protein n=1 Tax=Nothobranchius furzeri TaxID=105023 RepID=UPI0024045DB7|nr:uncharacterized protein LOC129164616 [Nothobranchius furzeri]
MCFLLVPAPSGQVFPHFLAGFTTLRQTLSLGGLSDLKSSFYQLLSPGERVRETSSWVPVDYTRQQHAKERKRGRRPEPEQEKEFRKRIEARLHKELHFRRFSVSSVIDLIPQTKGQELTGTAAFKSVSVGLIWSQTSSSSSAYPGPGRGAASQLGSSRPSSPRPPPPAPPAGPQGVPGPDWRCNLSNVSWVDPGASCRQDMPKTPPRGGVQEAS